MIIGNFIWGRVSAAKQLQLIRNKEEEKLLRYCKKFRLDAVCEAELIKHSDEWENLLEAYIRRYSTFTGENNVLLVLNAERHPRLLKVLTEAFDSNGLCPSFLLMWLLLEKAEHIWEAGETFKLFYGKISHRNSLIQEIAKKGSAQMICRFLDFFPKPVYKNDYTIEIESRALWEQFFKTVSLASQKKYFSVSPGKLSDDLQDILQAYGKWDLINKLILKHKQFKINSVSSFKVFVDYNRKNLDVLEFFLQHNDISKDFQQSLQDNRQWFAVNIYLDLFNNFVFTEPEAFCDFLGNCPEARYKKFSVTVRAEAGLFKPENHKLLLDYASHNGRSWFKYRENRLRFVMMADIYPQQVEKYLQDNGRELLLSHGEQKELLKKDIKCSLFLPEICEEAERMLFETQNRCVLLEYSEQFQFRHHENEYRFLMMFPYYEEEVMRYLSEYGKQLHLTEDEVKEFLKQNVKAVSLLNVQSSAVYKEYILPEKRRRGFGFRDSDVSMLIGEFGDNPDLLKKYLFREKKIPVDCEPKLFFCVDKELRDFYAQENGFDLKLLVQQAKKYGATDAEEELLNAELRDVIKDSFANKPLNRLTKDVADACFLRCSSHFYYTAFDRIVKILYNIAERNYLTA